MLRWTNNNSDVLCCSVTLTSLTRRAPGSASGAVHAYTSNPQQGRPSVSGSVYSPPMAGTAAPAGASDSFWRPAPPSAAGAQPARQWAPGASGRTAQQQQGGGGGGAMDVQQQQQQPRHRTPIPAIPSSFAELDGLSVAQLQRLSGDGVALRAMAEDMASARGMRELLVDLSKGNAEVSCDHTRTADSHSCGCGSSSRSAIVKSCWRPSAGAAPRKVSRHGRADHWQRPTGCSGFMWHARRCPWTA
jgi:hypothetical protein